MKKNLIIGGTVGAAAVVLTVILVVVLFAPEITLKRGGTSIVSGNTFDLPEAGEAGYITHRTYTVNFTIENSGSGSLILSGSPRVKITGTGNFTLKTDAPESIAPGGSANFTLVWSLSATGDGVDTNTITIQSNDADEKTYTFVLQVSYTSPG